MDMRPAIPLTFVFVGLLLLPSLAVGHPPGADPHAACVEPFPHKGVPTPMVTVRLTSYLDVLGASPLPCGAAATAEFGSHSPACPAPPFVGAIPGAYCGPVVGPGMMANCEWAPGVMTVPTELVIAFDPQPYAGFVTPAAPAYGPYPPGPWSPPNPYGVPARVIAFPTNVALPPDPAAGALPGGDWHWVGC